MIGWRHGTAGDGDDRARGCPEGSGFSAGAFAAFGGRAFKRPPRPRGSRRKRFHPCPRRILHARDRRPSAGFTGAIGAGSGRRWSVRRAVSWRLVSRRSCSEASRRRRRSSTCTCSRSRSRFTASSSIASTAGNRVSSQPPGSLTGGYTRNSSAGSIRHCWSSSFLALKRPRLMALRMVGLVLPVR